MMIMRTPRREAGRLINQTVTLRTITRSGHSRTGITVFCCICPRRTELVVINLISQHDPQPNPKFSRGGNSGFSPDPFAPIFADRTDLVPDPAHCVGRGLTPEKAQQRITLLAQASQPLPPAAGVFPGNDPDVTRQRLAVAESFWITQKDIGR